MKLRFYSEKFSSNLAKIIFKDKGKIIKYFKSFSKPNNSVHYVHKKSNHHPAVTKNLPGNINNRLSKISANEEMPQYQETLEKSGYEHVLRFQQTNKEKKKKERNRNVCWFSKNIKSNIGAQFPEIYR